MKYDATLKKLFQRPPNLLLSHVLGERIDVKRILPTELITVGNLHPDLLFETENGDIVHTELQGYTKGNFACRNLIYFGLVLRDYERPPIQVVFWIGEGTVGVTPGLHYDHRLHYRYELIDVRQLDGEWLLDSPNTGEVIFGILCKLEDARHSVQRILRRIAQLDVNEQREAVAQLLILSGLRGLTALVKAEVRNMPVTIDIHDNEFLEEVWTSGKEEGKQEGKQEGRQEGRQEGLQAGLRQTLLRNLDQKFGTLSPDLRLAVENADVETLERWNSRVIPSGTLSQVFE